jgi:hypothetical protein
VKNFRPIDVWEMRRRFALGEVNSRNFSQCNTASAEAVYLTREEKERLIKMLRSEDSLEVSKAISEHVHGSYVYRNIIIPKGIESWYVADLETTREEFARVEVLHNAYWERLSKGSFKLIDAAINPNTRVEVQRVRDIIVSIENGNSIDPSGIVLVCPEGSRTIGPWEIIEGHARLVATWLQVSGKLTNEYMQKEIEVVLGIY